MRKVVRFIAAALLVTLLGILMVPVIAGAASPPSAVATVTATQATPDLAVALAPLAWFIGLCYVLSPAVIAVVNRIKESMRLSGAWPFGVALASGVLESLSVNYVLRSYGVVTPTVGIVVVVGLLVGLHAAGVFDLGKLLGTFTPPGEPSGASTRL
jgi:hypothetical protein